ncbi:dihydrofolate reductase family protein [Algicella marina]|nr:dihydrofolate reductase family protein [Algicella marina]
MRRLVIWDMMTLDGRFEGAGPWQLDFHGLVWGEELEAFSIAQLDEAGTLLFGRRTYEGMAAHWSEATGPVAERMNAIEKRVATRAGVASVWTNSRPLIGEIATHIDALKAQPGKQDIFVFGSADLTAALLDIDVVDEIRLCLVPTVLGGGTPLFRNGERRNFDLAEARPLRSGGVILRYLRAKG